MAERWTAGGTVRHRRRETADCACVSQPASIKSQYVLHTLFTTLTLCHTHRQHAKSTSAHQPDLSGLMLQSTQRGSCWGSGKHNRVSVCRSHPFQAWDARWGLATFKHKKPLVLIRFSCSSFARLPSAKARLRFCCFKVCATMLVLYAPPLLPPQ